MYIQGRHGEFELDKAQYSTPNFFDRFFLIRAYWNPKSREEPALGDLASHGASWARSTKNEKKPQRKYVGHVEKLDLRFLQNKS